MKEFKISELMAKVNASDINTVYQGILDGRPEQSTIAYLRTIGGSQNSVDTIEGLSERYHFIRWMFDTEFMRSMCDLVSEAITEYALAFIQDYFVPSFITQDDYNAFTDAIDSRWYDSVKFVSPNFHNANWVNGGIYVGANSMLVPDTMEHIYTYNALHLDDNLVRATRDVISAYVVTMLKHSSRSVKRPDEDTVCIYNVNDTEAIEYGRWFAERVVGQFAYHTTIEKFFENLKEHASFHLENGLIVFEQAPDNKTLFQMVNANRVMECIKTSMGMSIRRQLSRHQLRGYFVDQYASDYFTRVQFCAAEKPEDIMLTFSVRDYKAIEKAAKEKEINVPPSFEYTLKFTLIDILSAIYQEVYKNDQNGIKAELNIGLILVEEVYRKMIFSVLEYMEHAVNHYTEREMIPMESYYNVGTEEYKEAMEVSTVGKTRGRYTAPIYE